MVIAMPTGKKEHVENTKEGYTDLEQRLGRLLADMEGVGEVNVMITMESRDEVGGIAILADGADNAVVVRNITEVVQALFPVDSHKIKVMKGNQTK